MNESAPSILVIRDANVRNGNNSFDAIRKWVAAIFPEYSRDFRVLELPDTVSDWDGIRLMVNWTLDPVRMWSDEIYQQILSMQDSCDKYGIPVINRVDRQILAGKSIAAEAVSEAGLRSPSMVLIRDPKEFLQDYGALSFPFMLRENWGHQGKILRIENPADINAATLKEFVNPVAIEIIDVRNPQDGWYRMKRYLASGPFGISLFSLRARDWIVRDGVADKGTAAMTELHHYTEQEDLNHSKFQEVARRLGMEVLAFDYSLDQEGKVVVWEVNPYTRMRFARHESLSQITSAQRGAAAIVALCRMRAGLPVNQRMIKVLGYAAQQVETQVKLDSGD